MKKIYTAILFLFVLLPSLYSQYIPTNEDLLINDVYPINTDSLLNFNAKSATVTNFYYNLRNWIPYCNSEPLKNPPITYIEVTFHVFLDSSGQNNSYLNTTVGRSRLVQLLDYANGIFSGGWGPTDSVSGVIYLPYNDTRIRFTLGNNNERIYFYNNTTLNHSVSFGNFNNYIKNNYPSRSDKLNIYFTAGYYRGKVKKENITITNNGSGYTSVPTITFSPISCKGEAIITDGRLTAIKILNDGEYSCFDPPKITITGGGGSGATAIVTKLTGGATGTSNMAFTNMNNLQYVIMNHCHEANDYVYGFTLAHELGHNLGLSHTFCGDNSNAICCNGSCSGGCNTSCHSEYLSDIFGNCPGTCPHYSEWKDPTSDDPKHTNNLMGGSDAQFYISPMQAGQMHRTLALLSTRKHVLPNTYSTIPLIIDSIEILDFSLKLYRDLEIVNSGELIILKDLEFSNGCEVRVTSGGKFVINNSSVKNSYNNKWAGIVVKNGGYLELNSASITVHDIKVQSGGTLRIKGALSIKGSCNIDIESGGYICIDNSTSINLQDIMSVINLHNGYRLGVNTSYVANPVTCLSNTSSLVITGNGKINTFSNDVYIQNKNYTTTNYITGNNFYVGSSVIPSSSVPQGPVILKSPSNVVFDADGTIFFNPSFEVQSGSTFEAR